MTVAPDGNPGRRLWDAIDGLMAAAVRERSALAGVLRLRPVDLDALRLIVSDPGTSPTAVSQALRMSTGGTNAVLERLIDAGLITRTRTPNGRRRVGVDPTVDGRAAVDAHRDPLIVELAALADDDEHLDRTIRSLTAATTALDAQTERHVGAAPTAADDAATPMSSVLWG